MNDSIGLYLNDIGKVSLLNAEEERELSRVIEAGRDAASLLETGATGADLKAAVAAPPLPAPPGQGPARPDPGGQPRPRARRRQVRLAPRVQVLHLRHVLDPPGDRPGARPEGQPDPHPR